MMKFVEVVMELRELMSEQIELEKDPEYLHEIINELSQRVRELERALKGIIDECTIYTQDEKTTERIRAIAKQAIKEGEDELLEP